MYNNLSSYISADTGDGEEKVISPGKCIFGSIILEAACQTTVQREINEGLLTKM